MEKLPSTNINEFYAEVNVRKPKKLFLLLTFDKRFPPLPKIATRGNTQFFLLANMWMLGFRLITY